MRPLALFPALLLLGGCIPFAHTSRPRPGSLAAVVDSVTTSPVLRRTTFGIEVYDPAAGRVVYALNPDKHLMPASNTKLVATSAAMALLGPDWRYRTDVYALGMDARGTARGLLVVGRGDPTWAPPFQPGDFAVAAALADSIRAAGVRRIDGDLLVDASAFEATQVNPSWEVGDLIWYYAAPVSAFALGEGTRRLVVVPGVAPGSAAGIRFIGPEPQGPVLNAIATVGGEGKANIDPDRLPGSDTLFLRGTIPFTAAPDTETVTVADASVYAARVLAGELATRGIVVGGTVRVLGDSAEARAARELASTPPPPTPGRRGGAPAPAAAVAPRAVASWMSAPVAQIVAACLKPSDNWLAEQLLKTLGAQKRGNGSWRAGLAVEREFLTGPVGLDSLDFSLRDGSGLSAQNLLTAHAITRLLAWVRSQPWGGTYRAALAEPGQPGTLQRRLVAYQGRLYAKTGSIANVNSLSGYVRTAAGRELVFSIMSNGSGVPSAQVRAGIDRIVAAIAAGGTQ